MATLLAKRCNVALVRLGDSLGRDEKRPSALLRELEGGVAIPALAHLVSGRFSSR